MKKEDTDITPVEGVDFYRDTVVQYLVSIDVNVGGFGSEDESAICSRAIENLRDGTSEGNAMIVHQEKIRDVELDMHTDLPFNRVEWVKNKLAELGLNEDGKPLRPYEKERPKNETTLFRFIHSPSEGIKHGV